MLKSISTNIMQFYANSLQLVLFSHQSKQPASFQFSCSCLLVNTEVNIYFTFYPHSNQLKRVASQQQQRTGQSVWLNSMNRLSLPKEVLMCFRQLNVIDTKFRWKHCISEKRIAKVHNFSSFNALKYIFEALSSPTSSHWIWRKLLTEV